MATPPAALALPGWFAHVRAARAVARTAEEVALWLRDRLATEPEALERVPSLRRLPRLDAESLGKALHRASHELFRVPAPSGPDAALLAGAPEGSPAERSRFTLFLREGLAPEGEVRLLVHAVVHLLLGHLRPDDPWGHWDRLADLSAPARRWDREVEELLAQPSVDRAGAWLLARHLRDVPVLSDEVPFAPDLLPFRPWPHQVHVAREILHRFPERFLLCDEVGLGKTIETGLAVRELYHRGLVRRCLLLVPAGVVRQWCEEMREKLNLYFEEFDGAAGLGALNPWNRPAPLVIASSHLVRRRDRMRQLLEAAPWDLVIVDEAHHARLSSEERPNRLLELLRALQRRTRGLLLLTATPMQTSLRDVFGLLELTGIRGAFADPAAFDAYFEHLSRPLDARAIEALAPTIRSFGREYGDEGLAARLWKARLGRLPRLRVRQLLDGENVDPAEIAKLDAAERAILRDVLLRRTPLHRSMFRHTRDLLRRYHRDGLVDVRIPEREPRDVFVPLSDDEDRIHRLIEDHLSRVYEAAKKLARGRAARTKFILEVYRRRLTSSRVAIRRSLDRRLARLRAGLGLGSDEADLAADVDGSVDGLDELAERAAEGGANDGDGSEDTPPPDPALARLELESLESLIEQVRVISPIDSKFQRFREDLDALTNTHGKAIVFTQFTDTLDFLRDALGAFISRSKLACFSGRGGEVFRDGAWVPTTKEEVKRRFNDTGDLAVLICTDAASEGLNLQTCGLLLNYDMPWNWARVEQRIGRVDRIGQRHARVSILNYYYQDSVEARIYARLRERIARFGAVVGPLQPIVAAVEDRIRAAAFLPRDQQAKAVDAAAESLAADADRAERENPPIDPLVDEVDLPKPPPAPSTARPADVEALLAAADSIRPGTAPGTWLAADGREPAAVAFDPRIADEHPDGARLLAPGEPLYEELLSAASEAPPADPQGLRAVHLHAALGPLRGAATLVVSEHGLAPACDTTEIRAALAEPPAASPIDRAAVAAAAEKLAADLVARASRHRSQEARLRGAIERQDARAAAKTLLRLFVIGVAIDQLTSSGAPSLDVQAALEDPGLPTGTLRDVWRGSPTAFGKKPLSDLARLATPVVDECVISADAYLVHAARRSLAELRRLRTIEARTAVDLIASFTPIAPAPGAAPSRDGVALTIVPDPTSGDSTR